MRSDTVHITELAQKLAAILPDAAVIPDDMEGEYTRRIFARMTVGPLSMSLRQKGDRITIDSGAADRNRYNLHAKNCPGITVDARKEPEQIANNIARRIIDKAGPSLEQLAAEIAEHDARAKKVSATIEQLSAACPELRWARETNGLSAKFSAYDSARGSISGRIESSGNITFDRTYSTTTDKAARVIAAIMS